ncbi:VP6 [Mobuck virus]|uniref:VP6 n=1 Tax=Mobuck virus TaxID=1408137 RepID=UPI0003BA1A21|nr:VP6 [Mobuck virus]AGX89725.1 VP6 [Mobuck virus]
MTRIVLLAPGDVIERCEAEIKERGIKTKIKDWKDDKTKEEQKQDKGAESTVDGHRNGVAESIGEGRSREDTQSLDGGTGGLPGRRELGSGKRRDTASAPEGSRRDDKKEKNTQLPVLLDKPETKTEDLKEGKEDKEHVGAKFNGDKGKETAVQIKTKILVLHDEIADKLEEEYDMKVETTIGKMTLDDDIMILEFGPALLKRMGFGTDVKDEQNDEMKRLRRVSETVNTKKKTGTMKKTVRVDSEKGLSELVGRRRIDPSTKKNLTHNTTRVSLISNAIEDVERAHVIFTAPTGDTNWKEVARTATRRSNIRAYRHTPGEVSLVEAFTTLLDVV